VVARNLCSRTIAYLAKGATWVDRQSNMSESGAMFRQMLILRINFLLRHEPYRRRPTRGGKNDITSTCHLLFAFEVCYRVDGEITYETDVPDPVRTLRRKIDRRPETLRRIDNRPTLHACSEARWAGLVGCASRELPDNLCIGVGTQSVR